MLGADLGFRTGLASAGVQEGLVKGEGTEGLLSNSFSIGWVIAGLGISPDTGMACIGTLVAILPTWSLQWDGIVVVSYGL